MRRASATRLTVLAICLSLGVLGTANPAAAAPPGVKADFSPIWNVIEEGFGWVWEWVGEAPVAREKLFLQAGTCVDPNGNPLPPGATCPPPAGSAFHPPIPGKKG
jgi:hypothetical protein